MAKYLRNNSGRTVETATVQTSAGSGDADKIPNLDANGRLDLSMMPSGLQVETKGIVAFENLSAGDFVNIFNDAGTLKVRKADASAATGGKKANGFVIAAYTTGQTAVVYYGNINSGVSGLTIGSEYFLSGSVAGAITATAPTTAAFIVQRLGVALSATELLVEIATPIELA